MPRETNSQLIARHQHVKELLEANKKKLERYKLGTAGRDRQARWCGSLYFTLLTIQSTMRDRGLHHA